MTDQESELQRPDLGIETVEQSSTFRLPADAMPWLGNEPIDLHTVAVKIDNFERPIRFGSVIGESNSIRKLATMVPEQQSRSAEQGMFKGLVSLLSNQPSPNIDRVVEVDSTLPIFKTTKSGKDVARLFFALTSDHDGTPVVVKVGIAQHKKQQELYGVLGHNTSHRRKKKRD